MRLAGKLFLRSLQSRVWQLPARWSDCLRITAIGTGAGYQLHLTISLRAGHLQAGDDRWRGKVQVEMIQRDADGERLASLNETLSLQLKKETYETTMKSGFPYLRLFTPKARAVSLRVIVRALNSDDVGSITIPLSALAR